MYYRAIAVTIMCTLGLSGATAGADTSPAIVPRPAEMTRSAGEFRLSDTTAIMLRSTHPEARIVAEYAAECLRRETGLPLPVRTLARGELGAGHIVFATAVSQGSSGIESYSLSVTPKVASLFAQEPRGLFLGVQTLRQMLARRDAWCLPCVRINDQPRYRWRGMLLDCGRHFMTKDFVKRYIDLLAYHKMNVLHWHLTEDQGWRIEITKYPRLTEIGAWRGEGDDRYGGFYTQEDIREIVAYAQARYVTIVPEIEMPGHSVAALAAYPGLSCTGGPFEVTTRWGVHSDVYCAGNERTFEFLQDVLSEVIELFPSEYIHIGGDECPKARWEACPKCQARINAEGLDSEHELQSYFIRRIERFLSARGRRLVGWDEILEGGLAPNATVQSWRGLSGAIAAAKAGHDVICSPTSHCYLDYAQSRAPGEPTQMGFISLETAYAFEPTPPQLTPAQARHVLGVEGNMWTEHAPQKRVDWQVFPRLCALSEVMWSPPELRDWDDFQRRMMTHYHRLDALGVTYFLAPPCCLTSEREFTNQVKLVLDNPFGRGVVRYTLDSSDPTADSPKYERPIPLTETTTIRAQTFLENGRTSDVAEFQFSKR